MVGTAYFDFEKVWSARASQTEECQKYKDKDITVKARTTANFVVISIARILESLFSIPAPSVRCRNFVFLVSIG